MKNNRPLVIKAKAAWKAIGNRHEKELVYPVVPYSSQYAINCPRIRKLSAEATSKPLMWVGLISDCHTMMLETMSCYR